MEAYLCLYCSNNRSESRGVYLIFREKPCLQRSIPYSDDGLHCGTHIFCLEAQFIAAVQIIVYAGAIMVLFLFVIMLLNLNIKEEAKGALPFQKMPARIYGDCSVCRYLYDNKIGIIARKT